MNKFNLPRRNLLKDRRAKRANLRRLQSGGSSLKLPACPPPRPISGKKQRKVLKKWRRAQKDALESGLVSMQDIEMMAADNSDGEQKAQPHEGEKKPYRVLVKKRAKLMLKKSKKQGKQATSDEDAMMHENVIRQ